MSVKNVRYRTAIRRCKDGDWEAVNDVRVGSICFFVKRSNGREFVARIEP
jgi:hypothetical protein